MRSCQIFQNISDGRCHSATMRMNVNYGDENEMGGLFEYDSQLRRSLQYLY